ncbi:MAG: hypothetical protein COW70_08065 [Hydrogenophilales bacterium CG18_big_fil_WC_8_21_14_2_50_58_12]|nr:MAG: hypothetical protein COW70_08065 [Hydrogenophilales bacterium CG18_big_fil_WC_8_21_14_2_50_58_12]
MWTRASNPHGCDDWQPCLRHGDRSPITPNRKRKDFQSGEFDKAGRNDLCPCGSGKKFKQCCGGVAIATLR